MKAFQFVILKIIRLVFKWQIKWDMFLEINEDVSCMHIKLLRIMQAFIHHDHQCSQ